MKTIHRLRLQNDSIIEDPVKILNEMKNYYKILYTRVETKKNMNIFSMTSGHLNLKIITKTEQIMK